jgi:hypothetical protein
LLTSVSHDVLVQIAALPSAEHAWKHIETSFASQSRARVINTHIALATSQKETSTAVEYIAKMKTLADEMTSVGMKLDDEEVCSYILTWLDVEYNLLVSSIAASSEPITLGELYSQLLSFENRLELQKDGQSMSSVNNASWGWGTFSRGRGGHDPGCGGGCRRGDYFNKPRKNFPPCQLCGRTNHLVFKCYKRFDPNYIGEEKSINSANSYGVDSNWYADSGATDQVIGELDKLTMKDNYNGSDKIYTANGPGTYIKHIGQSIIQTPLHDLKLNNVLHIPQASKNLASVHRIAS